MSDKPVYWFSELSKDSLNVAGGKGANLGEMTQLGFPVPPGFAVSVAAYYQAIRENGLEVPIKKILVELTDLEDSDKLEATSDAIKELIVKAPVPEPIAKAIEESYARLCHDTKIDNVLVAIRSSATAEDLPSASFAGQQATFLNIQGAQQVISAVRDCWASLFEARAIYYRVKHGFDHMRVGLCAVVQQMVQSQVSGVMFTADPVSGRLDRVVIEAGFGLGEAIVSGLISPDMYMLNHEASTILSKNIAEQTIGIFRLSDGQTNEGAIPKDQRKLQKLKDEHIIKLARIGLDIQKAYGGKPQDIEWALDDRDQLFIVQTRAITTLDKEQKAHEGEEAKTVDEEQQQGKTLLRGLPASPGQATGVVRLVNNRQDLSKVQPGDILVARMTSPDYVPVMKRSGGIITDAGGMTCHAAIVARELGIPCIVGAGQATTILHTGLVVTMDASTGVVIAGKRVLPKKEVEEKPVTEAQAIAPSHPITATKLYVNIADPDVAERVARDPSLADGVGLIRAEFMISALGTHPSLLAKQGKSSVFIEGLAHNLHRITAAFHPRPVVYRANDFKSNEYRGLPGGQEFEPHEENPMIGYRGCLRYVTDPTVFLMELEAIKKVRNEMSLGGLHLMIPFVRTVLEFKEVLELCRQAGLHPNQNGFRVGMMCEVPSNVFLADEFCAAGASFMSIGSNDLAQLILGSDRDSALLAADFDERNPAVIKAIRKVIKRCHDHGVTVSICGQMPSVYPETIQILVDAGIDAISVNPDVIQSTRRLLASAEQRFILDRLRRL